MTRLRFLPGQQQLFLREIGIKSKMNVEQLAVLVKTTPRNYRDWRREKLTIPTGAARVLCKGFGVVLPETEEVLIARWREHQSRANRIGGFARLEKHGSPGTFEGRSKGGTRGLASMRTRGIIPYSKTYKLPRFSCKLAEFVGILLGDGGITHTQVGITLNSEADREYTFFVSDLATGLFREAPKIYRFKVDKAVRLYYGSVNLPKYLISIGLVVGNKVKQQVGVPDWILKRKAFRIACLRGLMDTDGCTYKHEYKVRGKPYSYRKMAFSNRSIPLIKFVVNTLSELGVKSPKVTNRGVWLYNTGGARRYFELVGTHNPRLSL